MIGRPVLQQMPEPPEEQVSPIVWECQWLFMGVAGEDSLFSIA